MVEYIIYYILRLISRNFNCDFLITTSTHRSNRPINVKPFLYVNVILIIYIPTIVCTNILYT